MIEYLFIDDGSKDNSLKIIHKLADTDKRIHYISFSRNFGKEAAIYAGLKNAAGDYITILDADLQDPPSLIPKMLDSVIEEGYDCVGTRRVNRKDIQCFSHDFSFFLLNNNRNFALVV